MSSPANCYPVTILFCISKALNLPPIDLLAD
nr:MAG TPA: hypothetical protein [Caudoviricetes sp.]